MSILLAGILSACANVSRFEKNGLVAYGEQLNGASERLYYLILVEGNALDSDTMSVQIKLTPETSPVSVSELSPAFAGKYLQPFTPPSQWPEQWKKKAGQEDSYTGGGFNIRFKDNHLVSLGICSHCAGIREHPIIGRPDGEVFYSLPLTEQQMIEVFGNPKRIYRVNEVGY